MQTPTVRGRTLTTLVALGTLLTLAAIPAPAAADFHGVCTGFATAYANVELVYDPTTEAMAYGGEVNCPDSVVTITEVELVHVPDAGVPTQVANVTGEACEATVTMPCYLYDSGVDAPTGTLEVHMTFDVDDPATDGVDYPGVERSGTWLWLGDGQPVPVCRSVGFVPISAGAC